MTSTSDLPRGPAGADEPVVAGARTVRADGAVDVSAWLRLSVPLALVAIAASLAGILTDAAYARETANWAAQGVGQDIANLALYPLLVVCARAARRGSLGAYLLWLGVLGYSVYTYAIYAFALHFGPLFLPYVAVLGLSIYAFTGGMLSLDAARVKAVLAPRVPGAAAGILVAIGGLFSLLWLSEIVPSLASGTLPPSLQESGLITNPVYVLDLAVVLPAAIVTGVGLRRGRAWSYCLAPVLLVCFIALGAGIIVAVGVLAARGEAASLAPVIMIGTAIAAELAVLRGFVGAHDPEAGLAAVLRRTDSGG